LVAYLNSIQINLKQAIKYSKYITRGLAYKTHRSDAIPVPSNLFKVIVDSLSHEMTSFVIPNDDQRGEDPRLYQVSVWEVARLTGLDFNPPLSLAEADRLEVNGDAWVLPKFRSGFR
jgi:DNA/RNA endonuclease G (NUC1)